MNIEMDADAKHKVSVDGPHEQMDPIPFEGWTCAIKGRRIIKHLMEELRKQLNGEALLHHWEAKQRIDALTAPIIDWEMTGMATRALPRAQQKWVSKLLAKFLSYGTNMTCWKLGTQAKCPHCMCSQEDKEHIIWCPAESAMQVWNKSLEQLDNWMTATKTHPQLRQEIITGLRKWHDNQPPDIRSPGQTEAALAQDKIGWGMALEGCVASHWHLEQDKFWKACKSRRSSKHWTTALLTRLMTMVWDMWQHRNKALHESEENKQAIVEDGINQQIRQVYAQRRNQLARQMQPLMKRSLPQLLRLPAPYKRQWMATMVAIRNRAKGLIDRTTRL